jgi:hypothetical protein
MCNTMINHHNMLVTMSSQYQINNYINISLALNFEHIVKNTYTWREQVSAQALGFRPVI